MSKKIKDLITSMLLGIPKHKFDSNKCALLVKFIESNPKHTPIQVKAKIKSLL